MKNRVKLLGFALLAVSTAAPAQTVDDIIAKSIEARGGLAKLTAVQTIRMTADYSTLNLSVGDVRAKFTQTVRRPGKIRLDWSFPGFKLIQAYDGRTGWQILYAGKKTSRDPMTARDLGLLQDQADVDGPLVDYKLKSHKVELVGKEKVEEKDAYSLQVTFKSGEVRTFYIDAQSFLLIKSSGRGRVQGKDVRFESTFGDYKEVQGVMFPFTIEERTVQALDGHEARSKTTFRKIEVNVSVDDLMFGTP
jgi:predicted RNA-binding protein